MKDESLSYKAMLIQKLEKLLGININ